jgi:regulator of protease activity HflC (stomatin/prohibitin superfamily)
MATINDAVREMYLTQTGRAADPGGLEYFANRFGTSIEPDELAIFRQMAADEVAGQEARQAAAQQQAQQAEYEKQSAIAKAEGQARSNQLLQQTVTDKANRFWKWL